MHNELFIRCDFVVDGLVEKMFKTRFLRFVVFWGVFILVIFPLSILLISSGFTHLFCLFLPLFFVYLSTLYTTPIIGFSKLFMKKFRAVRGIT